MNEAEINCQWHKEVRSYLISQMFDFRKAHLLSESQGQIANAVKNAVITGIKQSVGYDLIDYGNIWPEYPIDMLTCPPMKRNNFSKYLLREAGINYFSKEYISTCMLILPKNIGA